MYSSQPEKARTGSLLPVAVLLGLVILSQPIAIKAADSGDASTTGVAMPGPDPGLREPSSGGSIVLRGTRPVIPAVEQSPNVRNQPSPPEPYMGWRPANQNFEGWNPEYNWGGLSYTPYPPPP